MKKWLVICFILLSTAIVGCSKSSSDGDGDGDRVITTDASANGIWVARATLSDGSIGESLLFIHSGRLYGQWYEPSNIEESSLLNGSYNISNNNINGNINEFNIYEDFLTRFAFSGTVVEKESIEIVNIETGKSFPFLYNEKLYEKPSSLSRLNGTWVYQNQFGKMTITVEGNGSFSGYSDWCKYSGSIDTINSNYNLYEVAGNVNCGQTVTVFGLATIGEVGGIPTLLMYTGDDYSTFVFLGLRQNDRTINTQYCPNGSIIPITEVCPDYTKVCPDGAVVSVGENCPIDTKVCPNGLIIHEEDECPIETKQCPNGSIVPINDTCPIETKQCPNGSVVLSTEQCPIQTKTCPNGSVIPVENECPDITKTCPNGSVIPVENECPRTDKLGYTSDKLDEILNGATGFTFEIYGLNNDYDYGSLSVTGYRYINNAGYWTAETEGVVCISPIYLPPVSGTDPTIVYPVGDTGGDCFNAHGGIRTDEHLNYWLDNNPDTNFWGEWYNNSVNIIHFQINSTNLGTPPFRTLTCEDGILTNGYYDTCYGFGWDTP